ncbi:hypothetical protein E4U33_006681 [Claviceps sp. LM78 group G4]|nr:hypothetical protein E4U33_006681 [Claviceps sp. LM78 group G4]
MTTIFSLEHRVRLYLRGYERGRRPVATQCLVITDGRYPIPNDETEQSREDMKHAMLMMLMEDKLFLSPIGEHPQRLLAVGTGTVGDRYPSAKVRGIDIAPIQPEWVPSNVSFLVDDCELDWIEKDVDLASLPISDLHFTSYDRLHEGSCESPFAGLRVRRVFDPGAGLSYKSCNQLATPLCDDGTMLESRRDSTTTTTRSSSKYLYERLETYAGRPLQALKMSEAEAEVAIAMARKSLDDESRRASLF